MDYRTGSIHGNVSPYYDDINFNTGGAGWEIAGIWLIIAAVLALVGGILVYFLFVHRKEEPKHGFWKWLKDFLSFKILWIEALLEITYYVATIFCILASFGMLADGPIAFLMMLIVMPVLLRIIYEAMLIGIKIWHNTQTIADNTGDSQIEVIARMAKQENNLAKAAKTETTKAAKSETTKAAKNETAKTGKTETAKTPKK